MNGIKALAATIGAATLFGVAAPGAWAGNAKEEANKKLVVEFYERVLNQKDVAAIDRYVGPYRQHNPQAADGPEGLKGYIGYLKDKVPRFHAQIRRVIAEGDLVVLHVHATPAPGARGMAIIDIFRVADGKLVEHWDVIQDIPEQSANANTMF
ncbi:MAG TPA: ester cyclase [Burkholderiales bacterium]|jgi:predicted SnoaL-like aldol condensation-catalyzing enzyme|nr:ester cyclase [Burkholderiales bacterium]